MRWLAGRVWTPEGWVEGHVALDAGSIVEVARGPPPGPATATGTVVPAFRNAHTHVGDAVARGDALPERLEEAVRPPHGYKHRVLASTPPARLVEGMRGALREAWEGGTGTVLDFREGGSPGLAQLREARRGLGVGVRAYARPATMALDAEEVRALLRHADGLAVSSLPDDPRAPALAEAARAAGKGFATHTHEGAPEPLDPVLDLRPELLVHLTFATRAELERVRDAAVPVAVCPRSNARWVKRLPDVRAMLDLGLDVGLGTDNAMLGPADVLAEARALLALARGVRPAEALAMLCGAMPRALGHPLARGAPADLLVFRARGGDPVADVLGEGAQVVHREAPPRLGASRTGQPSG